MKLELVIRRDVSHVEFTKDRKHSIGISVKDGMKEMPWPTVKKVKSASLAERSHAIAKDDAILSINGLPTKSLNGKDVSRLIKEAGPQLDLELEFEIREACISKSGIYQKKKMTLKLEKEAETFGFILRKKRFNNRFIMEFPVISYIVPGGPAYNCILRDGSMMAGDRLVKIDDLSLSSVSLMDIANILRQRDEAEFSVEYNVRLLIFPLHPMQERSDKVELDINVPDTDLGIVLASDHPSKIYIESIRRGSLAERCGAFCVGDVITAINGTSLLTTTKASCLLRHTKPSTKICLKPIEGAHEKDHIICGNSDAQDINGKRLSNSFDSCNVNLDYEICENSSNRRIYKAHLKSLFLFQDVIKNVMKLNSLFRLTHERYAGIDTTLQNIHNNCSLCKCAPCSVQICINCLSQINATCAQTTKIMYAIVMQFENFQTKVGEQYGQLSFGAILPPNIHAESFLRSFLDVKDIIIALINSLPDTFVEKTKIQSSFNHLAKNLEDGVDCNKTVEIIITASDIIQKLFLLSSFNSQSSKMRSITDQLVRKFLELQIPHIQPNSTICTHPGNSEFDKEKITEICSCYCGSSNNVSNKIPQTFSTNLSFNSMANKSSNVDEDLEENVEIPKLGINVSEETAFFNKATSENESHSESLLKNQTCNFANEATKCKPHYNEACQDQTRVVINKELTIDTKCSNNGCKIKHYNKTICDDKNMNPMRRRCWKSVDSFLKSRQTIPFVSVGNTESTSDKNSGIHEISKPRNTASHISASGNFLTSNTSHQFLKMSAAHMRRNQKYEDPAALNYESTPASSVRNEAQLNSPFGKMKRCSDVFDVKMMTDGSGYGFTLGLENRGSQSLPVITAIRSKSPAHKTGLLLKSDRVLAINGRRTIGKSLEEVENLIKEVSDADRITLTIEFDIFVSEVKYGTFDVVLDKTLKTGLHFNDMKKDSPMVVKGIVKGSAAHRSREIFPGDEILFFKCLRSEEFDPHTCDYHRNESVHLTVRRKPLKDTELINDKNSEHHYSSVSSSPRKVPSFIVGCTTMRSITGTQAPMLEQQVTLFRDPITWDFGFLVAENSESGRAYIGDIKPGGPAQASGVIKKSDRIVEVNGVPVGIGKKRSILSLLTQANDKIDLLIRRTYSETSNAPDIKNYAA